MNGLPIKDIKTFLHGKYRLTVDAVGLFKAGVQNTNYLIHASSGRFVFRVYGRESMTDLPYTLRLLRILRRHDFSVPRLVRAANNQWLTRFRGKASVLYEYLPGRNTKRITIRLIRQLGAKQAKMHLLLKRVRPLYRHDNWDPADLLKSVRAKRTWLMSTYPESSMAIKFILDALKQFNFPKNLPSGGTHQDIKPENVLVNKTGDLCGVVDFDNGYYGAWLYDVATTIVWYCFNRHELVLRRLKAFMAAYQGQRPLTSLEKRYFHQALRFRLLREAIIWFLYVSHRPPEARKQADHFLTLYRRFKWPADKLNRIL